MINVQQLSGQGKEGLENCPQIYHFDLEIQEFQELIMNPRAVLERAGIKVKTPISILLLSWEGLQNNQGDVAQMEADGGTTPPKRPPKVCTITTGDGGMVLTANPG